MLDALSRFGKLLRLLGAAALASLQDAYWQRGTPGVSPAGSGFDPRLPIFEPFGFAAPDFHSALPGFL
jgi:hypothetical protein